MKAEKLLKMIYLLLENSQLSAPELSRRLSVSVRTIYRYVDTLSTAGFPVYATHGRNGGIALLPEFKLNSTVVDQQEQVDILAALQTLQTLKVDDGMALDKLAAIFKRDPIAWLAIDPTAFGARAQQSQDLTLLRNAILKQQFIQFNYLNANNQQAQRWVYPYQVLFKDHAWYLSGYAVERQAPRLFKLARLTDLRSAQQPADPEQPWLTSQPRGKVAEHPLTVHMVAAPALKYRIIDSFSADEIQEQADGHLLVTSRMDDSDWLLTYLLSFGAGLRVLQPDSLKRRVRVELEKMLVNYQ